MKTWQDFFGKLNESQKLNEEFFEKVGEVKSMEVVGVDSDETYDWFLEVTCQDGKKFYTKLRHEKSFDPDDDY